MTLSSLLINFKFKPVTDEMRSRGFAGASAEALYTYTPDYTIVIDGNTVEYVDEDANITLFKLEEF